MTAKKITKDKKITPETKHKEKIAELENNWKRALADYKNLEKRVEEEKSAVVNFANSVLLLKILPVLDNLELLIKHGGDESIKMVVSEFKKVLDSEELVEIEALGKEFDAQTMDAIERAGESKTVTEVLQTGYMLKNKVLRPARVKVGQKEGK